MLYSPGGMPRLLAILAIAYLLSAGVPHFASLDTSATITHVLLIFSFLIGFLVNRSMERKRTLVSASDNERTRLRHLLHLAEGMKDARFEKTLRTAVIAYHKLIAKKFRAHRQSLDAFRSISHAIYQYKPKTSTQEKLWGEMLTTVREIAIDRGVLEQAINGGLAGYSWLVISTYSFMILILLLLNRPGPSIIPFGTWAAMSGMFLVLDLLYRLDRLSKKETDHLQGQYEENVPAR